VPAIRARVAKQGVVTRATTTLTELPPLDYAAPELGLPTGRVDASGKPVRVACRTCHERVVSPSRDAYHRKAAVFHRTIRLRHGAKTCQTCHRPPRFDDFNLADSTPVPPGEVMRLCGQCHASRLEEYLHGAHGGMSGYWDRRRGPRRRNHCLGCHDPHHPRIEPVRPAPKPRN